MESGTSLHNAQVQKSILPWERRSSWVGNPFLVINHKLNWNLGAISEFQIREAQGTRFFPVLMQFHAEATEKDPEGSRLQKKRSGVEDETGIENPKLWRKSLKESPIGDRRSATTAFFGRPDVSIRGRGISWSRGPSESQRSNHKEVERPFPIFQRNNGLNSALRSKIFFQAQEQTEGEEEIQKLSLFKKVEWIQRHHKDSLSVKRIQMYLSIADLLQSFNLRIPNPPSFLGRHTSSHATLAPPLPRVAPFHRNCLKIFSILFRTETGKVKTLDQYAWKECRTDLIAFKVFFCCSKSIKRDEY